MKYRLVKGKRKAIGSYNKYVARAVHEQTVSYLDFAKELGETAGTAKVADMHAVMGKVLRILVQHLQQGDIVEIPYIGRMKMELTSAAVDSPEEFKTDEHIKGMHICFTPERYKGEQELMKGVKLSKVSPPACTYSETLEVSDFPRREGAFK